MPYVTGLDAETTGLPEWKKPSGDECQPHLVQLAAVLADEDTQEVVQSMDVIIRPDGWEIPEETTAIHGISTEMAMDLGVPEAQAYDMLLAICGDHNRVAFNRTFDQRIIRIAAKRYGTLDEQAKWALKDNFSCAMLDARKVMGGKQPKLIDAYKHFTGKDLENAHSAMADTMACLAIYFALPQTIGE